MNLDKLTGFAIKAAIAAAFVGQLPAFTKWVQIQTAKVLYASRTSTWGSPIFFEAQKTNLSNNQTRRTE